MSSNTCTTLSPRQKLKRVFLWGGVVLVLMSATQFVLSILFQSPITIFPPLSGLVIFRSLEEAERATSLPLNRLSDILPGYETVGAWYTEGGPDLPARSFVLIFWKDGKRIVEISLKATALEEERGVWKKNDRYRETRTTEHTVTLTQKEERSSCRTASDPTIELCPFREVVLIGNEMSVLVLAIDQQAGVDLNTSQLVERLQEFVDAQKTPVLRSPSL